MEIVNKNKTLTEVFGASTGLRQAALVLAGIAILAIAAKISIPMWPVPITLGTLAVLTLATTYPPRLGLATILGYMLVGVMGFDVFATSSSENYGIHYMMGSTGGYLVGYVLATLALGFAARKGWDRSYGKMALAMLGANALIYIPGLIGLGLLYGWDKPLFQWGLTPFLIGDVLKLALAVMIFPTLWKMIGKTRS